MSDRIKKINILIKRELGRIILKEISFPKNILTTITRVETLKDLRESRVFVSVFPERETKEILKILERKIYNLQQILNKRLKIKYVPKIKFFEDKELEEAQKIDGILDKIEKD